MGPGSDAQRRTIRSFVLREGRLTRGQAAAFETLWPRFGIDWREQDAALDLSAAFGNTAPVTLEIGFGNGESLARTAAAHPDRNYLGVEVHRPGVGHLLMRIGELGLGNLRVMREDAVLLMRRGLKDASLQGINLFFPDPWPKKRHHKRRIVQPAFAARCAELLAAGGVLHCATDWEPYAGHMLGVLEAEPRLRNLAGAGRFSPRPADRPKTKFEQRGERLGHGVWDLLYERT